MRISIVQGPYYPVPAVLNTGAEKVWHGLGMRFAALGHHVTHIARRYAGMADNEVAAGVNYVRIRSRSAPASPFFYRLYDLAYSFRARSALPRGADIVVTNCIWLPILLRSTDRGRVYVHVARYPKRQMRLYRHADRLQAVSTAVAEAIVREVPTAADRVRVIPPYLSNEAPSLDDSKFGDRPSTVLYVGRLHPEKGVHLLIEVFRRGAPAGWRLRIVGNHATIAGGGGEAYLNRLRALADERVEFCGAVSHAGLNEGYRAAALLVYPSLAERGESFGMVPLEAMSCGCPAIVSDLRCFRDYLAPGVNGWTFDHRAPSPVEALTNVLRAAIADAQRREQFARSGYTTACEYTLEKVARRYVDDFATLVGGSR